MKWKDKIYNMLEILIYIEMLRRDYSWKERDWNFSAVNSGKLKIMIPKLIIKELILGFVTNYIISIVSTLDLLVKNYWWCP